VDVPELLRILDFHPVSEAALAPEMHAEGTELIYSVPTDEFAVSRVIIDAEFLGHEIDAAMRHDGPQILLCTEGEVLLHAKSASLTLTRGQAAWVAADDGPIRLVAEDAAELFRVSTGL
jgi:mannose-6-phosphate isomerase